MPLDDQTKPIAIPPPPENYDEVATIPPPPDEYGEDATEIKPNVGRKALSTLYTAASQFAEGAVLNPARVTAKAMALPGTSGLKGLKDYAASKAETLPPEQKAVALKYLGKLGELPKTPKVKPTWWGEEIIGGLSRLAGEIYGVPGKVVGGVAGVVSGGLGSLTGKVASPFISRTLPKIAGEAAGMSGFSALGDDDISGEALGERMKSGGIMGAVFGVTKAARIPKIGSFLNNIIRQYGTRALGARAGVYDDTSLKRLAGAIRDGSLIDNAPDLAQDIVNEALYTWFSIKKTPKGAARVIAQEAKNIGLVDDAEAYQKKLEEMAVTSGRPPEEAAPARADMRKANLITQQRIAEERVAIRKAIQVQRQGGGGYSDALKAAMATSARTPAQATTFAEMEHTPKLGAIDYGETALAKTREVGPVDVGHTSGVEQPGFVFLADGTISKFKTIPQRAKSAVAQYRAEEKLQEREVKERDKGEDGGTVLYSFPIHKAVGYIDRFLFGGVDYEPRIEFWRKEARDNGDSFIDASGRNVSRVAVFEDMDTKSKAEYRKNLIKTGNRYVFVTESPDGSAEIREMSKDAGRKHEAQLLRDTRNFEHAVNNMFEKMFPGIPDGADVTREYRQAETATLEAMRQASEFAMEGINRKLSDGKTLTAGERKLLISRGMLEEVPPANPPEGAERVSTKPSPGGLENVFDPNAASRASLDRIRDEIANAETGWQGLLKELFMGKAREHEILLKRAGRRDKMADKGIGTQEALATTPEPTAEQLADVEKIPEGSGGTTLYSLPFDKLIKALDRGLFGDDEPVGREVAQPLFTLKKNDERKRAWGLSVEGNLKRMGEVGEAILKPTTAYLKDGGQMAQSALYKNVIPAIGKMLKGAGVPRAIGHVPFARQKVYKTAIRRLAGIIEGREKPANAWEADAAKTIKEVFDDIGGKMTQYGGTITDPLSGKKVPWSAMKDYWPREYRDLDGFLSDENFFHLRDRAAELIAKRHNPAMYAEDPARAKKAAIDALESMRHDLKSNRYGHLEMARILTDADIAELRAEWNYLHPDKKFPLEPKYTINGLISYVEKAYDRISWLKNLGQDTMLNTIKGDTQMLAPKVVADNIPRLLNGANRDYVLDTFQNYLGHGWNDKTMTKLLGAINTWQNLKLAFASIPNAFQWMTNTMPELSVGEMYDTLKMYARAPFDKTIRQFFAESGASQYQEGAKKVEVQDQAALSQITEILLKTNGFSFEEKWVNAFIGALGGKSKAETLANKLIESGGGSWRDPARINALKSLGWDTDQIKAMIERGAMNPDDVARLADSAWYMKRMTQFSNDFLSKPKSWQKPGIALLAKFKNFPYNMSRELGRWAVDFAKFFQPYKVVDGKTKLWFGREGDPTKLMKGALFMTVAGYLSTEIKKNLYPQLGLQYYSDIIEGKPGIIQALFYMTQAGSLGLAMDAINALGRGEKGLISLALGPTASDVLNGWQLLSSVADTAGKALSAQDPQWFARRKAKHEYDLKNFVSKMNAPAKMAMLAIFPKFKEAKDFQAWSYLVGSAYDEFKTLWVSQGAEAANEFWDVLQKTQGAEWEARFKRKMRKPTVRDIHNWRKGKEKNPEDVD